MFLLFTCDLRGETQASPPVTLIRINNLTDFVSIHALCVHSAVAVSALNGEFAVKTEKKTVQFSEDVQVETIEPEQEPVFIDEVLLFFYTLIYMCVYIYVYEIISI